MSPDLGAVNRLNDHLDAVVTGDAKRVHDLDPVSGAAVARFFAADDAPGPPAGLADQIWEQLLQHSAPVERIPRAPSLPADRNGLVPPGPLHPAPPHRGSSALAFLATAALIVLTLIGGVVASRGSLRLIAPDQRAVIIPAIDDTPESALPSSVIADVTLMRTTLEQLPSLERTHQLALHRYWLSPGAVQPVGSQADTGVGLDLFIVETGRVTVEADGPVHVTRAVASPGAAPIVIEPGTEVILEVGDQLYAPAVVTFRRRNDGLMTATTLDYSLSTLGDLWSSMSPPEGVSFDYGTPYTYPTTLPAVPAEATVRRLTLAPGAQVAARDLPGLELVYVEAGTLDLDYANPETPTTPERTFTVRAGSGTDTFGRTPEQAVLANQGDESLAVLANRGDVPLVILTASLVPANAGEATPPPSWSDGWGSGDRIEE